MRRSLGIATGILLLAWNSPAEDLASMGEGNVVLRWRLAGLTSKPAPPPLHLTGWLNSPELALESLRGKVVVLNFWATWCGACKESVPVINELARKYEGKVVFLGICATQGAQDLPELVNSLGIRYPVAQDVETKTVTAYGANSFPDYYLIDQRGKLALADCANHKLEAAIRKLLAE